jgi:hypothetical protein
MRNDDHNQWFNLAAFCQKPEDFAASTGHPGETGEPNGANPPPARQYRLSMRQQNSANSSSTIGGLV